MRKSYIAPIVNVYEIRANCLLSTSTNSLNTNEAGQGTSGHGVNFAHGNDGDDW